VVRKTGISLLAVIACVAGSMLSIAGQATAAPGLDAKLSAQGWSASKNVSGCQSSLHLLTPTRNSSFYAADPASLLPPGARHSAADLRVARKNAEAKIHWQTSLTCKEGKPGKPVPARPGKKSAQDTFTSINWSGYVSEQNSGYLGAYMEWVVPDGDDSFPNPVSTSIWPGIGTGESTADTLVQAGTHSDGQPVFDEDGNLAGYDTSYYFWLELYPQESEQQITNLDVGPGDDVSALAEYDPATGQAYFELANYTTGEGVYAYQEVTGGVVGTGSQSEWVAERPAYCLDECGLQSLSNFGDMRIYAAQAAKGDTWSDPVTFPYVGDVNPDAWEMRDCGGTLLAQPDEIIDNTDFVDHWQDYGSFDTLPC
jgi:hypothetical protein